MIHRMSGYGGCIRAQVAAMIGMKPMGPPEWLQTIYDSGTAHEDVCIDAMRAEGYEVEDQQREVIIEIDEGVQLVGHLDGTVTRPFIPRADIYIPENLRRRVLEVKSPNAWGRFQKAHLTNDWSEPLMHKYGFQISGYMHPMGMEAVIACVDDGVVKTFTIEVPPFTLAQIKARIRDIESFAADGKLPTLCSQDDGDGCPFRYLHEGQAEVEEDTALDAMVADYEEYQSRKKDAEELLKIQRTAILAHLGDSMQRVTGSSKVTRYTTTRTSYDHDAMRADGVDVEKYAKVNESSGLRVTRREGDDV